MKGYLDSTKAWWRSRIITQLPQINGALGIASMVRAVDDIIGANITGDKQIMLNLGYLIMELRLHLI
ncbi:MAG: hypothetical protein M3258_08845 [Thermoproteota archaeon]|jgi:hypothetical protein|nr:hypothetical protein [Thermoproteota archaeon]